MEINQQTIDLLKALMPKGLVIMAPSYGQSWYLPKHRLATDVSQLDVQFVLQAPHTPHLTIRQFKNRKPRSDACQISVTK